MGLLKTRDERQEANAAKDAAKEARRRRDQNPARRYEHKVKFIPKSNQKGVLGSKNMELLLNKAGVEGWELVSLYEDRAVFKREMTDPSEAELEELAAEPDGD